MPPGTTIRAIPPASSSKGSSPASRDRRSPVLRSTWATSQNESVGIRSIPRSVARRQDGSRSAAQLNDRHAAYALCVTSDDEIAVALRAVDPSSMIPTEPGMVALLRSRVDSAVDPDAAARWIAARAAISDRPTRSARAASDAATARSSTPVPSSMRCRARRWLLRSPARTRTPAARRRPRRRS